jgi:hypothetical protein
LCTFWKLSSINYEIGEESRSNCIIKYFHACTYPRYWSELSLREKTFFLDNNFNCRLIHFFTVQKKRREKNLVIKKMINASWMWREISFVRSYVLPLVQKSVIQLEHGEGERERKSKVCGMHARILMQMKIDNVYSLNYPFAKLTIFAKSFSLNFSFDSFSSSRLHVKMLAHRKWLQ